MLTEMRTPHQIALASPGWPPGLVVNGIVTYVAAMQSALLVQGVRATVLSWSRPAAPWPGFVLPIEQFSPRRGFGRRVYDVAARLLLPRHDRSNPRPVWLARAVRHLCQTTGLDLLEMEETFGWAVQVAESVPVPVVVRLHGPWFLTGPANGARVDTAFSRRVRAERQGLLAAAGISAPSRDVLERVRSHYGIQLPDARVIPNPITPIDEEMTWSLDSCDPHRILFIGRFDRLKGADTVIRAFPHLAVDRPHLRLWFVGPDHGLALEGQAPMPLKAFLQREITDPSVRNRIDVLGTLDQVAIGNLRRQARVTILASIYENFPYAAAEAALVGCPLVVSRVGGVCELIGHERDGLWAEAGDSMSFAHQVARLLDDDALAARLGRQARSTVSKRLAPEHVAKEMLDFYAEVLGRWEASHGSRAVTAFGRGGDVGAETPNRK